MTRGLIALLCLGLLAACQNAGGLSANAAARNAPFAADRRGQGVDGLLVGHRLMEAGENELALRAYLRAAGEQGINADVLSALGSANLQLGRLGQAETLLRRALEMDPTFVPAMNNLGVVLMERGKAGEARLVFQQAYALDSGETDSIRENLRLAIARTENIDTPDAEMGYTGVITTQEPKKTDDFSLVRRDKGQFVLLSQL
ncbi:tetratricopeptide repeat protein [Fertoebacter nigrum]|uniref:Tetratricopeptide repeat protein n=1 Tax=Fertoeibacter niger TaxID=2656921 RepID=A0A8X8H252_9RHOB|nr:tetratricopeptide repeat protein [Fertoeibacter niger]NUB44168.1 tetratricopeptide repeat protein [Fertoeibacter niger]